MQSGARQTFWRRGSEFTALEWIESNGVNTRSGASCSYIDTGIEAKYGMTAHFEWQWVRQPTSGSSGFAIMFGGGKYISGTGWKTWAVGTENNGRIIYNGSGMSGGGEFQTTKASDGYYISNGTCGNFNYHSTPKNTWFLFAQNESWSQGRYGSFLLAHFAILRLRYGNMSLNGGLVHEYVPVERKLDSEVGLLDILTGEFFGSASKVKFTAGPKKQIHMSEIASL